MRLAMVHKELRQLLPWSILLAVLMGLQWLSVGVFDRLDEQSWLDLDGALLPGEGEAQALFSMLLGFLVGMGLMPREYDDGTIQFLRGLPQSPWQILLAKTIAGALFIVGWTLLDDASAWLLQMSNPHSMLGSQFDLRTALWDTALASLLSLCVMCHGLLLSFFRRLGVLLYVVGLWAVLTWGETHPGLLIVSPLRLLDYTYVHRRLVVPYGAIGLQVAVAGGSYGLAALLWLLPADVVQGLYAGLDESRLGKLFKGGLGVVALGALLAMVGTLAEDEEGQDEGFAAEPAATLQTHHYHFTYPAGLRGTMLTVGEAADADYAWIAETLGVEGGPPVLADLTEDSDEHAGVASGHKLRMGLSRFIEPADAQAVLTHETTHILSAVAGGQGFRSAGVSTWSFNEGLADRMEFTRYPRLQEQEARLLAAAITVERNRVELPALFDQRAFMAEQAEELVYPLGRLWVDAWATACGPDIFAKLLFHMAQPEFPQGLRGQAFWQELSLRSACGWGAVAAAFETELAAAKTRARALSERFPTPVARVARSAGHAELVVSFDPPLHEVDLDTPLRVRLSLRHDAGASRGAMFHFEEPVGADWDEAMDVAKHALAGTELDPETLAELDAMLAATETDPDAEVSASIVDRASTGDAGVLDAGPPGPALGDVPGKRVSEPLSVRFAIPSALASEPFDYLLSVAPLGAAHAVHGRWTRAWR